MARKRKTDTSMNKKGRLQRFFFIMPRQDASMKELADRILELNLVEEVSLTEYDSGFIAKIRFDNSMPPKRVASYLSGYISKDYGRIVKG